MKCVEKLSVLKFSSELPMHEARKCLEHRSDTFWIAENPSFAEIRIELLKVEHVTDIWIMTSTFDASPMYVQIYGVEHKQTSYTELVRKSDLPCLKEHRWHHFNIGVFNSKYYKLQFSKNYGNQEHIAIRQIRFLRSKEVSAIILQEPSHFVLTDGPNVSDNQAIVLKTVANGWPLPTYQWYNGRKKVKGANQSELKLNLHCAPSMTRMFRCIRCKMVGKEVAYNIYRVRCGNCGYTFSYKEFDTWEQWVIETREREKVIQIERMALVKSKEQMENFQNEKYV